MWYACMGTFQILLFALIAIKIKGIAFPAATCRNGALTAVSVNAPGAHTFPEIVLARHGKIAHITFLFNGLVRRAHSP